MNTSSLALIANGHIDDYDFLASHIKKHARVIAVDGGLNHCYRMNLVPDAVIGDLDSVNPDILAFYKQQQIEIQNFPCEKDETDLELALKVCQMDTLEQAVVYGALGNRIDQTLVNLYLLCRYPERLFFYSRHETIFSLNKHTKVSCQVGQTISLMPLGEPVTHLTTKNLKWELNKATLDKSFFSVSNVCLKNFFSVEFASGQLLCSLNHFLSSLI